MKSEKKIVVSEEEKSPLKFDTSGMIGISKRFQQLNRMILRDLNERNRSPSFYVYSKDDITTFLSNPYSNQKNLRNAVIYIYSASSHFRRLIQYFVGLSDLSYVVAPYKIDTSKAKAKTIRTQYQKTLNFLSNMDIKNQFSKVLTVCLREDIFFGTAWIGADDVTLQQLPSDYCNVSTIEGNVMNVTFDFSYFDAYNDQLKFYPAEFTTKYNLYKKQGSSVRYQELDSPTSFAIKCNNDIPTYAVPPFAGILREIYDLEDYKSLKLSKTELENYAILQMKLDMDDQGGFVLDLDTAKDFWKNLDSVLPEEVGSVLTPMSIDKISFEKSGVGDTDYIAEAEERLYTSAGVSSLLFNNEKASSNALLLSIKADQAITFGIVKGIEGAINRILRAQSFGKNFKVTFLDVSPYNRKEMGDAYIKACQFGMPMVSYYCASQGLSQAEMDTMNFLEDDVLGVKSRFIPLSSSSTQSSSTTSGEAGRPEADAGTLTDSGETWKEGGGDSE